ncbi:helix-turn-helix transcriptional regulator [Sphingobacterium haloxyli]|nr:LuxR C-terminal-related transcriptional regulator [Sphingobacterium haloxyli]
MQIQKLHPDFFKRLSDKAIQKLTLLDQKYCTYLYLKMTTKQIAQALHVEPQSVRMFKYRLKQKFGLDKEVDLEDFLTNIK